MDKKWKNRNCEDCVFRDGDKCRRFPPVGNPHYEISYYYPKIYNKDIDFYNNACAEFSERIG